MNKKKELVETLQYAGYRLITDAPKLITDKDDFGVEISIILDITNSGVPTATLNKYTSTKGDD